MKQKAVSVVIVPLLLIGILTSAFDIQPARAEPETWHVDDDGPTDFPTIQEAISSSLVAEGDTIFVHSGTYYENVVVNKTVSLIGENWNTTVVRGVVPDSKWQSVIAIRSDFVTMANFTVTNGLKGIYIRGRRSTVTDCVAYENGFGLVIDPNIASGYSTNVLRRNQLFSNTYNLLVVGHWYFNDYVQDIDSSNLVNGKPVYYLVNEENISITPETYPNIGYLGIVGSTNVQIANLSLSRNGNGLLVAFSQNTLIENVEVTYNYRGICLKNSPQTIVNHCNLSYNSQGAFMYYSDNVKIEENRISHNEAGIFLMCSNSNEICHNDFVGNSPYYQARFHMSANNQIYHNNFICDTQQAYIETQGYANSWDDGYPSGGNYWSDYTGVDSDHDGIGDTEYVIDVDNRDSYPLMAPMTVFNAGMWDGVSYNVDVISNSTVSDFLFSEFEKLVSFNVTGPDGTTGFCRVTISNGLLGDPYVVLVNGFPPLTIDEWSNGTHTFLYFTYDHSTKPVEIIGTTVVPEFPTWISLAVIFALFAAFTVIYKRRILRTPAR